MNFYQSWTKHLRDTSVRRKLNLLTVIIALCVVTLSVVAARMQYVDLYETRKDTLRSQVELSYGVLDHFAKLAETGKMPLADAQQQAILTLEAMRSDKDTNYFNIYSDQYVMLMHPFRKELVGQNLQKFRSVDGVRLYHEMVQTARRGGGYVNYEWAKPGQDTPLPKLTYAGMYTPWNWVVSNGMYLDEIQAQAWTFTLIMTAAGAALVILVIALSWLIGNRIVLPLREATSIADAIARGRMDNAMPPPSTDEIGQLFTAMQRMQDQLHAVIAAQMEMARQHEAGTISYRIDADDFPGEYGVMVTDTNSLIASHVDIKLQIISLAQRYAVGDLAADMPELPG